MLNKTPLFEAHQESGAKLVDFHGWHMPLHYGSQLHEHTAVRTLAGVFDVSHMVVIDVLGDEALPFLRYVLANDIARLKSEGHALYSCLLNEAGGVIDDLIAYYLTRQHIRLVVNCGTGAGDFEWLQSQADGFSVELQLQPTLAILAVQGPEAIHKTLPLLSRPLSHDAAHLMPFQCAYREGTLVARTGYTGEDGFEIILPARQAIPLWQNLIEKGCQPCGLGARDTLRLEAGFPLYGNEMTTTVSPLVAGLGWTIHWQDASRDFIGKSALTRQKEAGITEKLVGLTLKDKGVLRSNLEVIVEGVGTGIITSGGFSPTLQKGIALARVPMDSGASASVSLRGKFLPVAIGAPRFVRQGQILVTA